MERRKGRTWGYESLAKARGTLREAAHTALEAHVVLVCPLGSYEHDVRMNDNKVKHRH
jgi:hypothetical protein